MRLIRVLIALVASVLLTASLAEAATSGAPFKADLTLQASFAGTPVPGVFAVTTSGAGHASHLGRVTASSTETLDFASSPGSTVLRDGRMVLVAANGDELHWMYVGTGSPPGEQGISTISGTFMITGGTGRFSDATGNGVIHGAANAATGVVSVSYRGAISS
jgi:hypothetical protein